eukprot:GHVR01064175.1.p1 GENE.GHVR01064175.1~~GHVR01064175.1.p1  ORF type:complete len:183 (+),score=16.37 GHVR01064175.1:250-798(+)
MRLPCSCGCRSDHSSVGRSLHHFRHTHQPIRYRFNCPWCGFRFGADLHDKHRDHVAACHGKSKGSGGNPGAIKFLTEELWQMDGILWEGSAAYRGDWLYMDTYGFLKALRRRVCRYSDWVICMNLCRFLLEQLVMLELYGGSTINIDEIIVPDDMHRGLELVLLLEAGADTTHPGTAWRNPD